jgi:hypothetical protein
MASIRSTHSGWWPFSRVARKKVTPKTANAPTHPAIVATPPIEEHVVSVAMLVAAGIPAKAHVRRPAARNRPRVLMTPES